MNIPTFQLIFHLNFLNQYLHNHTTLAPGPNPSMDGSGFGMMTMVMLGWVVVATALYFLRPPSLRRSLSEKPANQVDDGLVMNDTIYFILS